MVDTEMFGDDNLLEKVKSQFPCRDEVINKLARQLDSIKWPFMLIHGPHSTGKTAITRALLKTLDIPCSWTNCLEVGNLKSLQSKILYDIEKTFNPRLESDEEDLPTSALNNDAFIDALIMSLERLIVKFYKVSTFNIPRTVRKTPRTPKKTPRSTSRRSSPEDNQIETAENSECKFFIVLDNYDKLISNSINILPVLYETRKAMLNKVTLIVIMISTFCYDHLLSNFVIIPKPVNFSFPSFPVDCLPKVLSKLVTDKTDETYERYSEVVSSTLASSIADLNKLSSICEISFMDQIDTIESGKPEEMDRQLRKFFLERTEFYVKDAISLSRSPLPVSSTVQELPKSAKYLLIASFLASYNSKASDKKFFVMASDKRKVARASSRKEQVITGPKLFTLERLLHIYEALVYLNESANHNLNETMLNQPTNQLLSQIESLLSLKLLAKANSAVISPLSSLTKYQISDFITYEFIESICDPLEIKLREHLSL